MTTAQEFTAQSLRDPDTFWSREARRLHWFKPYDCVFDGGNPPFARWFPGGETNLCYNAVDRHAETQPDAAALIYVSSETGEDVTLSYAALKAQVETFAALLIDKNVERGDRVLIYMPMVAEAVIAMLACVRIGAVHSVVFGGFASQALADRIDDLEPKVIISADAGLRGGKTIAYGPLLSGALESAHWSPPTLLFKDRRLDGDPAWAAMGALDLDSELARHEGASVPCTPLPSDAPSYVLYTSGTTGKPKGIQRDTAGHAVGLLASMRHVYDARPGETFFATSDIGWVVGHSYIVYGPLLHGMATIVYEGTPVYPDAGVWWRLIERYKPSVIFSSPTAMRVLKGYDEALIKDRDLSSVRRFFLAGEPLDAATAQWASDVLGMPVYDHCWQTETGWPIIGPLPGVEEHPLKWGSPSFPVFGYDVQIIDEETGAVLPAGQKGMLAIKWPLPPGGMTTVWRDDDRFKEAYFKRYGDTLYYLTFDFAMRDADGYVFLLGRTDDVLNVAGHRLGTKEIEGSLCSHSDVAEAAVVGAADQVKGQIPVAFVVLKDQDTEVSDSALKQHVDSQLGAIARPGKIVMVPGLPKTRSGKVLRRALQALVDEADPGSLATLDDPSVLDAARDALQRS